MLQTGKLPLTKAEARQINPVVLAFVGDAVYSLYVRTRLIVTGEGRASEFQRASAKVVSAKGQSEFLNELIPLFTEEEEEIFRRGRNAKKGSKSKSASAVEYNRSTGLEAVLGYLHLTGESERIEELLSHLSDELFYAEKAAKVYKP